MIKVIIFDLGNVVVKFDTHRSAGKIASLSGAPEQAVFDLFFDSEVSNRHHDGALNGRDLYRIVTERFSLTLSFEEFRDIWNDIFWENESVCSLVRALKKDYPVFLMSNIGDLHFEHIRRSFPIMREFDRLILSYEVGASKPSPVIYARAIKEAGCDPAQIVFIDDRPELIEAACTHGIVGVTYTSTEDLCRRLADILGKPVCHA